MTGDGTCGVFIHEGVVVGKVAEPMGGRVTGRGGASGVTTGCGRGRHIYIYKCECRWDHCCVLSGCLLFLSLCSSGLQDLLRLNPPSLLMLITVDFSVRYDVWQSN